MPCIVHEHVDVTVALADVLDQLRHRGDIGQVRCVRTRPPAGSLDLVLERLETLPRSRHEDHPGPGDTQHPGGRLTDA